MPQSQRSLQPGNEATSPHHNFRAGQRKITTITETEPQAFAFLTSHACERVSLASLHGHITYPLPFLPSLPSLPPLPPLSLLPPLPPLTPPFPSSPPLPPLPSLSSLRQSALELERMTEQRKHEEEAWYRQQQLLMEAEEQRRRVLEGEEKKLTDQRARYVCGKEEREYVCMWRGETCWRK